MPTRSRIALICLVVTLAVPAWAQSQVGSNARPLITQRIDPSQRGMLRGNMRPEATAANDRGAIGYDSPMEHMLLQLKRSPAQEQALRQYIDDLQKPASPNYHKWLTAQEFGQRFGLARQDLDTITGWLESQGLKVNLIYPSAMLIDFSGTAGQVRAAFQAEIHRFDVNGVAHFANAADPQIPAALAPAVAGVVSLHDFMPNAMHQMRPAYTFTSGGFQYQAVVPGDLATIYNLNPLFAAGMSGQGQTIVLIEDTNVYSTADWTTFRSAFGLAGYTAGSFLQVHPAPPSGPNNCSNPGVNGDDIEAILDAEYASAAAPSATIELASCANTSTFGGLIALQNLLNGASPPPIVSISYGQCEAFNGAAANAAYSAAYQQAAAEGVSVFVSSGDSGAAGCDQNKTGGTHGIGVNALASTPYNVAVGGTDFGDTYAGTNSTYWNSTNASTFASALSYVPEIPWNNSCAGALLASAFGFATTYGTGGFCNSSTASANGYLTTGAGSGGPSACATGSPTVGGVVGGTCAGYAKPSWQSLVGNPADGVRDIPDVSLFAANGVWGHYYVFCHSDPANGGTPCTGAPSTWSGAGGTSFAAPIVAGIQALVNQKTGSRWGNPNPIYYSMAAAEYGASGNNSCNSTLGQGAASSCVFYDVRQGDIDVNCTGTRNCYLPSGTNGVLSTSNSAYAPAFGTNIGWDFATGIGTLNAANLVNGWPSLPTPDFSISASPSSVTITQGGAAGSSTVTVTAVNGFTSSVGLTVTGCPPGVTCSLPTPVSPAPTAASTLTITPTAGASLGTFSLTITGTSGALSHPATVTLTVNSASGPPAQGLIGYWNFDEAGGPIAHDTSGNGRDGTVNGATWTAGKISGGLSFNGSTNNVVTGSIALGNTFSVSAWVNPAVVPQKAWVRIAETRYNGGLYVGTNASGTKYKLIVNTGIGATGSCGGPGYGCAEGGTVATGWHLVTATYDGAIGRLYVDGALVGSETFTAPPATNFPLYIASYYGGGGYSWNGAADEVRLYNRALTSTDVTAIYNYTGGPPDTTPPTTPGNVSATAVSTTQINVTWSASFDLVGVTGYNVYRDGNLAGSPTGLSFTDTGLAPSTTYSYTVVALDAAGNPSTPSVPVLATTLTPDTTLPTVAITAPTANAAVSNTVTVTATASDNIAVAEVRFQLDGVNLGAVLTSAPYSISWDTTTTSNGSHALTAIAKDTSGNPQTSTPVAVTVSNTQVGPPTLGLIGYWNFDEGQGIIAHDTSAGGHNGAVNGASWTAGKINGALSFNGITNNVVTGNIALGNTFSVSVWVNPAAVPQKGYVRIAETRYNGGLYLGANGNGTKYKFIVNTAIGATGSCGGAAYGCAEGGTIAPGWHLVTATYDGAIAKLYVDGSLVGSDTFTAPPATNFPLYIASYYAGAGYAWNGAADEVRLYNRALTAAEVANIFGP
ncbi:MAG: hypothetical protein HYX25_02150 [Candidatus Solibacter usitatus]|nr:hypothetical protein [Candidatus Solibacter usitatus]